MFIFGSGNVGFFFVKAFTNYMNIFLFFKKIKRSTFVSSAWSFGVFIPSTTGNDFEGFSIPDFIHYIYFPTLILEKEPVFSLLNVQC